MASIAETAMTDRRRLVLAGELTRRYGHAVDLDRLTGIATELEAFDGRLAAPGDHTPFPLSHSQSRILLMEMMLPGDCENLPMAAFEIRGPVRQTILRQAVDDVLRRHPGLLTRLVYADDGSPQQVVIPLEEEPVPLPVVEASALGLEGDFRDIADAACAPWWKEPIDLEADRLVRAQYVVVGENHGILCFAWHHLAFDGWSYDVFVRDLSFAYRERAAGREPVWEPILTYRSYVEWERLNISAYADQDAAYWRKFLAEDVSELFPQHQFEHAPAEHHVATMSADSVAAFLATTRDLKAFPLAAVVAAVGAELAARFDADEFNVGTMLSGRYESLFNQTIGCFVNPMAIGVRGASAWVAQIAPLTRQILDSMRHNQTPFDELVRLSENPRDRRRWYQAVVVLDGETPTIDFGPGFSAQTMHVRQPNASIPVAVQVIPHAGTWQVQGRWRADVLTREAGRALVEGVKERLESLSVASDRA